MAKLMENNFNNPGLKQSEIAKFLEPSSSTVQRFIREINLHSPHRIPPSPETSHTRKQKTPNTNFDDVKVTSNGFKMTSNDLKTNSNEQLRKKNEFKGGASIGTNENYVDEIVQVNYL